MIYLRRKYYRSFWNWIDVFSLLLNLIYLACDLKSYNVGPTRDVSAVAVFLMWIKLLYFLRLFAPTAAFIRLVIQVFKDMFVFLFIYFIVLLSYSFTFFILSYDLYQSDPRQCPLLSYYELQGHNCLSWEVLAKLSSGIWHHFCHAWCSGWLGLFSSVFESTMSFILKYGHKVQ